MPASLWLALSLLLASVPAGAQDGPPAAENAEAADDTYTADELAPSGAEGEAAEAAEPVRTVITSGTEKPVQGAEIKPAAKLNKKGRPAASKAKAPAAAAAPAHKGIAKVPAGAPKAAAVLAAPAAPAKAPAPPAAVPATPFAQYNP